MNPLRRFCVLLLFFAVYVLVSNGCAYFTPEAVFVRTSGPDDPYARYVAGRIGVPQPGYRMRYMAVAYDWLSGNGLSAGEQQQALSLDAAPAAPSQNSPIPAAPGLASWLDARQATGLPGGPRNPIAQPGRPATGAAGFAGGDDFLLTDRKLPGSDYQTFANCLDDSFATAAATLSARKVSHPGDTAALTDWVRGQDAVFSNCAGQNGTPASIPPDAAAGAPLWLRQDRSYQQAAAHFYATDYDGAATQLQQIAAERDSPWQHTARFVLARIAIRRATVGQVGDVPAAAQAAPNAPYSQARAAAEDAYRDANARQRTPRLSEARRQLQAILADPAMAQFHHSAAGLLDLVTLQVDPLEQARTLTARLTALDRAQTPGLFRQALIDIHYFPGGSLPEHASGSPGGDAGDLLAWIRTMSRILPAPGQAQFAGLISIPSNRISKNEAERREAAQQALAGWRSRHTTPWLIAALASAEPGDTAVPELLQAAAGLPANSPAALAATYQRLRLAGPTAAARAEVLALLPTLAKQGQSRSTLNLFTMLLQRNTPTFQDFLADAGALPAAEAGEEDEESVSTTTATAGLCHTSGSPTATPLFDDDTASILNTRLPLRLIAQAAQTAALPANLRYQLAQAAWTRAVLLRQPQIAHAMTPLLTGCYPAWQPWLAKYDSATTPEDREANGLLALMRFASTEPIVRGGFERPDGFATYSEFRNNWWQASKPDAPSASSSDPNAPVSVTAPTFFGTQPATLAQLPDPAFLTEADRAAARQEITALRAIPCAADYFAAAALAWQKAHPNDPRTPDILGFAERVIRNGWTTDATKELNHRLFVIVQTQYKGSEWAKKYTTWE